jgi:hypothetical protein
VVEKGGVYYRGRAITCRFILYLRQGKRDAPLKIHDHAMDAVRYAVMGLPDTGGGESILVENASYGGGSDMPGLGGSRMPQLSLYERHEPGWTRNVKEKGKEIPRF